MERTRLDKAALGAVIRRLRKERGWTLEHLGDLTGTNTGNLSRLERGIHGASTDAYDRICTALGYTFAEVLAMSEGTTRQTAVASMIPLIDINSIDALRQAPDGPAIDDVPVFSDVPAEAFAIVMPDDAMADTFGRGDMLAVDPTAELAHGVIGLIYLPDARTALVREIYVLGAQIQLIPRNPRMAPVVIDTDFEFIGRIIIRLERRY